MPLYKITCGSVVVYDQDQRFLRLFADPLGGLRARLGHNRLADLHNPRKPDRERRTLAGLALDRDVAPHHLAEAFADREPKTGAAVFAGGGRIGLGEFVE